MHHEEREATRILITEQDIRHCRTAIAVANRSAVQLYGRLVLGEEPESDVADILRHVDRLKTEMEPVLTWRTLCYLARSVRAKQLARRAAAEREGASLWSPQAIYCYVALALLGLRVVLHLRVVSLLRLQPVLRYLHG